MRNITKIISLVIVVAMIATLAVAFTGCGPVEKDPDKLYVGLECAYAPFNYTLTKQIDGSLPIYNSNYKKQRRAFAYGYDVQIAQAIAKSMGKELVIVKLEWDALIPAVQAGTIDMIIAGMSPTAERKDSIAFSENYYESNLVVVVRKDGAYANATKLADLSGATLVAQKETFHDTALSEQAHDYNITRATPMEDFPAMINALNTKAVDGYIAEEPGAIENCTSNTDFTYIKLVNNLTGFKAADEDTAIAVGVAKNSPILDGINTALKGLTQADHDAMMKKAIEQAANAVE